MTPERNLGAVDTLREQKDAVDQEPIGLLDNNEVCLQAPAKCRLPHDRAVLTRCSYVPVTNGPRPRQHSCIQAPSPRAERPTVENFDCDAAGGGASLNVLKERDAVLGHCLLKDDDACCHDGTRLFATASYTRTSCCTDKVGEQCES